MNVFLNPFNKYKEVIAMKKQILIEQYTVLKFKTQYPKYNNILQDKLEGTTVTLNKLLDIIVQSDPTYIQSKNEVGKLQETILKLYCDQPKEKIVTEEFQNYVKEGFAKQYNYINTKGEKIDTLVNLTTVDNFETFILPFKNIDSVNQKQGIKEYTYFEEIDQLITKGEIVKAQETNDWLMYIPLTKEQSILLGKKTKWCISQETSENFFNEDGYNNASPFLIQISKNTKESVTIDGEKVKVTVKYQFHFADNIVKIWDTSDDKVYINLIILNNSLIEQFKKSLNQLQNMFSSDKYEKSKLNIDTNIHIQYLLTKDNLLLEKINLRYVRQNGYYIQYIKNPSEQVQLQQVNQDGDQIQYIKTPSEQVQMQQIKKYGFQIQYIKNPSEKLQLQQVNQHGYSIRYIKNPSEQVQLQQVNQNGYSIQFIKNPSEQIQLQQVNKNYKQLRYIKNPTEQVKQLYKRLTTTTEQKNLFKKLLDI